ncbi:MAG: hypothetical protein FJ267_04865 [Planctomycetes bacterium]|nr:hypothetical protein [Planctomycetota bacterium]
MTDRVFFDRGFNDPMKQPSADRLGDFACTRRLTDRVIRVDSNSQEDDVLDLPVSELRDGDFPNRHDTTLGLTHPEIIEFIESMLLANPDLKPDKDARPCQRAHSVYLPQHYEARYAYPLVVWLHGDGGTDQDLSELMPQISDRNYIGLAVRGDRTMEQGFGWSLNTDSLNTLVSDIRSLVTSLRRQYHIHSERIYLAGFESGATAAVEVMFKQPEWFGGVLSLNGRFPNSVEPNVLTEELRDKRILLTMSTGQQKSLVGEVVAAGQVLYGAGMKVGTRVYQDTGVRPSKKMLRDIDHWLMDGICTDAGNTVA